MHEAADPFCSRKKRFNSTARLALTAMVEPASLVHANRRCTTFCAALCDAAKRADSAALPESIGRSMLSQIRGSRQPARSLPIISFPRAARATFSGLGARAVAARVPKDALAKHC